MVEGEETGTVRGRLQEVAPAEYGSPAVGSEPAHFVSAPSNQSVVQPESPRLGYAPRLNGFAANSIPKAPLALQHPDGCTVLSHGLSEGSAGEASANNDEIKVHV